jgi:hypothetical protein
VTGWLALGLMGKLCRHCRHGDRPRLILLFKGEQEFIHRTGGHSSPPAGKQDKCGASELLLALEGER